MKRAAVIFLGLLFVAIAIVVFSSSASTPKQTSSPTPYVSEIDKLIKQAEADAAQAKSEKITSGKIYDSLVALHKDTKIKDVTYPTKKTLNISINTTSNNVNEVSEWYIAMVEKMFTGAALDQADYDSYTFKLYVNKKSIAFLSILKNDTGKWFTSTLSLTVFESKYESYIKAAYDASAFFQSMDSQKAFEKDLEGIADKYGIDYTP